MFNRVNPLYLSGLKNPGQITSINPFVETFAQGVTANNNFLWTSLAVEF